MNGSFLALRYKLNAYFTSPTRSKEQLSTNSELSSEHGSELWSNNTLVCSPSEFWLNLSGKHLYDTHEFKFAWKFGVKNSKCTMHIWLTSLPQIFSKFTQIFSIYSDYYWYISAFWSENTPKFEWKPLVWHTWVQVCLKV